MRWWPRQRWKRILLGLSGGLLLVVLSLPLWIDPVVRGVVVDAATASLGVETELAGVHVGLVDGTFSFDGLVLQNPPGFKEDIFLRAGRGLLTLEAGTVLGSHVVARTLAIQGLDLHLERAVNKTNYGVITDHIKSRPSSEGSGRTFVIERVVIRDVTVRYDLAVAGVRAGAPVHIDEIVLTDLGGDKKGGAHLTDLIPDILRGVLQSVAGLGTDKLPGKVAAGLKKVGGLFGKGD